MISRRRTAILSVLLALPLPSAGFAEPATPSAAAQSCQQRVERNRSRGRLIGGLLGGAAGLIGGRRGNGAALVGALVPAGALLGDAIAGLLDCDEREKAAAATEEAVRGGVGTTTNWTSTTRPGVTGSSTVTAAATPAAEGDACLTVTDVVIVDGQETRAPKRMCRRPPTNRFVRV
jgi:surface antigen